MATIGGLNGFNNLLYATKKRFISEALERNAGHVPLDLSYKEPSRPTEVLNAPRAQINGKYGDLLYMPTIQRSRIDLNHTAGFDPTILNAVRNKYVDVSGVLIPNKELRKKPDTNTTVHPFVPYGIVK